MRGRRWRRGSSPSSGSSGRWTLPTCGPTIRTIPISSGSSGACRSAEGRALRVAVNTHVEPWRVVSVFFDRDIRGHTMKLHVDREADALYLRLDDSVIVESAEVSPGVVLDYKRLQRGRGRRDAPPLQALPGPQALGARVRDRLGLASVAGDPRGAPRPSLEDQRQAQRPLRHGLHRGGPALLRADQGERPVCRGGAQPGPCEPPRQVRARHRGDERAADEGERRHRDPLPRRRPTSMTSPRTCWRARSAPRR